MRRRSSGADLDEIEDLYRRRLGELRRVATAIAGNRELGVDAVQDAFAAAIRERRSFRGQGSLDGWIWRIVVNAARDAAMRARREPAFDGLVDETVQPASANGDVRALVAALPERQRHVLFLRYYADLDYETIAETLGIAGGTVGATLNQALHALEEAVAEVRS